MARRNGKIMQVCFRFCNILSCHTVQKHFIVGILFRHSAVTSNILLFLECIII